ncbi:MAG: pyruvate kinase, partial [Phycisphaerae bacterium]
MSMIRTKIVATMGPAVASVEALLALFRQGVDVCRLNFSHGSLDEHLLMLRKIREAAAMHDQPVAILGDLCGPKIRLGKIKPVGDTGGMPIATGDELILQRAPVEGGDGVVSSIFPQMIDDVQIGHRVLIEDGLLRFLCVDKNYNRLVLQCTDGGVLKSSKGINLPDTDVQTPAITDKDWRDADWAIDNDLDYLALSFVRHADDINLLRQHLVNKVSDIHIVAKIEKPEAVKAIAGIIEATDGLMVARGDLGVEMDVAEVPIIQKDLVRRCQAAGKPVIVATQMLNSMITDSSPTRAEVSDVANAIFDGTDAVMLSGETSVGKFPVVTVRTMAHIAEVTETYLDTLPPRGEPTLALKTLPVSAAMARGVWQVVNDMKLRLVVVWSQTGSTARLFSKNRMSVPILALSSDHRALRRMALHYGVIPQEMPPPTTTLDLITWVDGFVRGKKMAAPGDRIVIVSGLSMSTPGTMNNFVIHTVGEDWAEGPASAPAPATPSSPTHLHDMPVHQ